MNLLEITKKYNLSVLNDRLVVPAIMPDDEILFLLTEGYNLIFELSPGD